VGSDTLFCVCYMLECGRKHGMSPASPRRPQTPGSLAKELNLQSTPRVLARLGDEVRSQIGLTALASNLGLSRTHLYKALSEEGNPDMETFRSALAALNLGFYLRRRRSRQVSMPAYLGREAYEFTKVRFTKVYVDDRPLGDVLQEEIRWWEKTHRRTPDLPCHPTYLRRVTKKQSKPTLRMLLAILDAIDMDLRIETVENAKRRKRQQAERLRAAKNAVYWDSHY
jgi:probable addiction module antidote protein